jgi:hypothetical protein
MKVPMRIPMTEYLEIDLETERWGCRRCARDLGPARGNYKEGTLVYDRDPVEIHRPLIDPGRYEFTFAPDMQIDVDALKAQWAARPAGTVIPLGRDVTAEPLRVDAGGRSS